MTYSPPKKLFTMLLTGVVCSLLIFTYTRRPKNIVEDAPVLQDVGIWHSKKTLVAESGIQSISNIPLNFLESTCSTKATSRGGHQYVISFSFYGNVKNTRSYFQGIERNAELIRQLYPGWIMRVYHNIREPQVRHLLNQTQRSYLDVLDTCFVEDLPGYGNLSGSQPNVWRFLAMSDPLVDVALSRDLDSNLNERELAAVQEWLYFSNASMHVMRDHQYHDVPILAGMWGVRLNESNRCEWRKMIERLLKRAKVARDKGFDQKLLAEEVWSHSSQLGWVLQHDSYYCKKYNTTGKMLAFPTERRKEPMNFVGSRFHVDSKPMTKTCPVSCRRQLNWTMC